MKQQRRIWHLVIALLVILMMTGCSTKETVTKKDSIKVGIMLSDVGLGDQSFSDSAFRGLMKARDELGIIFDYRELKDTKTYEQGLKELIKDGNDVVIGLGFMVQEDLEKVAKQYPKQRFILVDSISDLPNVTSIAFKEDEGSFLAGVVAALATKTNNVGFIGGDDVPLIRKFAEGFEKGVHAVNPSASVHTVYAGDFGNDKLGANIAKDMFAKKCDVVYTAAGFTGVGALREAEARGVYAIGVDSDQYFYAEKAVVTSMVKNVDVALFRVLKQYVEKGELPTGTVQLGLAENGVGLAPIRVIPWDDQKQQLLEQWKQNIVDGKVATK
ncbi:MULTISPECIES: BMP family ABC transporter substrate-binding protein [unclassified Geobacillus]|uniref:BMP family lipoprotein n=1 Tax=unclassified Geobacillus TaxID=2642459 RepID=UPI000BE46DBB|nr:MULTISPECIES: BMP family ABC transporter substrate-binding protein [unclassified Geobacillus]PDM40021.1 BMP family ABC transporter substrate-binding protein [Parageobacillus yumthangensis]RDV21039.1 BMP family ABC transporter substrate-binding protein [Parageobacillus toebii]TXK90969.1 BMP family ABC transporter substrate-binding protein [Parageobacillus sp. SY1]PUF88630.1 BMP family ABC transporter substrate-binding protein [Geobacillus sp. LYN3]TXK88737.1 BMP family ABC transporter substr